jgi:D-alanine-D-alanine ligase
MSRLKVAILAGGRSSEHEISLASARSVLESLDPAEYDVVTVAIGRDGRWELGSGDGSVAETLPVPAANAPATLGAVDVVLPLLHGPFGEDGTVQGLLELAGVPYVGAGVAASALCMDKDLFKKVLRDSGIPVARHVALREGDAVENPFGFPCFVKPARLGSSVGITKAHDEAELDDAVELAGVPYVGAGVAASALCMDKDLFKKVLRDSGIPVARHVALREGDAVENPFGFPCFVKPARLGSSVGITKAHDEAELGDAVELAFRHDDKVLVEEFLDGIEVEVGVLGNREPIASVPGQIVPLGHEWYDYASKYDEGGMQLVIPPDLPEPVLEEVQRAAVESFRVTECEGMARVDCFVVDGSRVVVNELNTIPGFTSTSVYAKLFDASGIPYEALLRRLIELAVERHDRRSKLQY